MSELLSPHFFENEPFATLQCGNVTVRLSYTALNLMAGWLHNGAHGYIYHGISGEILDAFEAVTAEAANLSYERYKVNEGCQ